MEFGHIYKISFINSTPIIQFSRLFHSFDFEKCKQLQPNNCTATQYQHLMHFTVKAIKQTKTSFATENLLLLDQLFSSRSATTMAIFEHRRARLPPHCMAGDRTKLLGITRAKYDRIQTSNTLF